MKSEEKIDEMVKKLREISEVEGTEAGEAMGFLADLWERRPYLNKEFEDALVLEIEKQYKDFDEFYTLVDVEEEVKYIRKRKQIVMK